MMNFFGLVHTYDLQIRLHRRDLHQTLAFCGHVFTIKLLLTNWNLDTWLKTNVVTKCTSSFMLFMAARPCVTMFVFGATAWTAILRQIIMTSLNGNIFRVTGHLCGEFTGHRWILLTKASDAELRCFLWSTPWINGWINNREAGDLRHNRAHYDVIVMYTTRILQLPHKNPVIPLKSTVHPQTPVCTYCVFDKIFCTYPFNFNPL